MTHKWARWLHNPCRLGRPHRFQSGGQNQRWPTSGQGGYITPAAWGVPTLRVAAASSSVLEWLTKFLALHLVLTMGFNGHIFFFCDNASTLLRGMTQWMKLNSGLDRFGKHVLGKLNFCKYHEFSLAAQHDSHHTGMAVGWQYIADALATQAQTNVHGHPLPWWWFFRCLDDAPSFLLFRSSLVLKPVAYFPRLQPLVLANKSMLAE